MLPKVWSSLLKTKMEVDAIPDGDGQRNPLDESGWVELGWINLRVSGVSTTFFSPSASRKSSNLGGTLSWCALSWSRACSGNMLIEGCTVR